MADSIIDFAEVASDLQTIIVNLRPEVTADVFKNLQDENYQSQLNAYSTKLTAIINTLQANGGSDLFDNKGVQRMFTHISNRSSSISQDLLDLNAQQTALFKAQQAMKELFILEHEIMDFLTAGQTKTDTYAIFIHGEGVNSDKIYQANISAEEVYGDLQNGIHVGGNNIISTNKKGQITGLDFQKKDLWQKYDFKEISPKDYARITGLADTAINAMMEQRDTLSGRIGQTNSQIKDLTKELEALRKELKDRFDYLENMQPHKGLLLNEEFLKLKALFDDRTAQIRRAYGYRSTMTRREKDLSTLLFSDTANIQILFDYYTKNAPLTIKSTQTNKKEESYNIKASWNRGHIVEALVRLQEDSGGALTTETAFKESLNRDIWWSQADVQSKVTGQSIQVKSMLSQEFGSIQIASLWSVMDLANSLLTLLNEYRNLPMQAQQKVANIVERQLAEAGSQTTKPAMQIARKITQDIEAALKI